jgi:prepilin-type N-terminal cleavage/methylation domain-containing protein
MSRPLERNRRRGHSRGMTLVEVLMAMAILVTGLVAVFALLNTGFNSHKRAIQETEAAMVAASELDELRAKFSRGILPESDAKGAFRPCADFPNHSVNRRIFPLNTAQNTGAADTEYFVRLEVRWKQRGDDKSTRVDTIMFLNRKPAADPPLTRR